MIGNYINHSLENDMNFLQNKMKHFSVYLTEPPHIFQQISVGQGASEKGL